MSELRSRKGDGERVKEENIEPKDKKLQFTIRTSFKDSYIFILTIILGGLFLLSIIFGYYYLFVDVLGECNGICELQPLQDALPHQFGSCKPRAVDFLQFNRIPRTGSTTVKTVLKELQDYKAFKMKQPYQTFRYGFMADGKTRNDNSKFNADDAKYITQYVERLHKKISDKKTVLEGHFFYEDFVPVTTSLKNYTTASITMIREPIERLASAYAMIRRSDQPEEAFASVTKRLSTKTLGECVLSPSCSKKNRLKQWCSLQTTYLCGIGNGCKQNEDGGYDNESIEIAKRILAENYTAFGITEHMKQSVSIFEKILPTYFEDGSNSLRIVRTMYRGKPYMKWGSSYGEAYEMPSLPEQYRFLKEVCQADLEIYRYAKSLFSQRYDICFPNDSESVNKKVKDFDISIKEEGKEIREEGL